MINDEKTKLVKNIIELSKIPSDINEHLLTLYNTIVELDAKNVVELGTRSGLSTQSLLAGVVETDGFLTCRDIQPMLYREGPDNTTFLERLGDPSQYNKYINIEIGNSLKCYSDWDDRSIDLLYIDTDHTAEQIYNELTLWHIKVKKDGIIIMHDVCLNSATLRDGLMKWISENENYEYDENVNNNGLGFLIFEN